MIALREGSLFFLFFFPPLFKRGRGLEAANRPDGKSHDIDTARVHTVRHDMTRYEHVLVEHEVWHDTYVGHVGFKF